MNKQNFLTYPLLITGIFLIFASGCKKDEDDNNGGNNPGIPVLTTTAVADITPTSAKSGGNITSNGGTTVTARGVCWSTATNPTVSDNKTSDGTGEGSFTSNIGDLLPNTTYYVRAYATNSKGTGYGSVITFTSQQADSSGSFTDPRDGNVYQYITIGSQVWMAKNLRYLPSVTGPGEGSQTMPCYYVYSYYGTDVNSANSEGNYYTHGVLYNWPAAMNGASSSTANPSGVQGVCPAGWHIPSDAEWTQLTTYLGGDSLAGGKLKATTHWNYPNTGASDETGFTALPGGFRNSDGTFHGIGFNGYWWSATENDTNSVWNRHLGCYLSNINRYFTYKEMGFSVRCVRD